MTDLLAAWQARLDRARWFAGKGLGGRLTGLRALPAYTAAGLPLVRSELGMVDYGPRQETYHLLTGYLPRGAAEPHALVTTGVLDGVEVDIVDAPASPRAMSALAAALPLAASGVRWLADADPLDATPRLFSGEQSNTSVVIGTTLLKLFRRLETGTNLDVEVLEALNGSGLTPELYAVLAGGGYDLGMLCQRLEDVVDGWEAATRACAAEVPFEAELAALGHALRGVHRALADRFGTTVLAADDLAQTMSARLDAAAGEIAALRPWAGSLRGVLAPAPGREFVAQRVHGDFHLGQALLGPDGWHIIDFEGEPLKTLDERRRPDTVCRDLAGLLRSIDYARSAHREPSGPAARAWARAGREAFLTGYGELPADLRALLRAYELDKAVYEVVYESRNRPDWVQIPLAAVEDEAQRGARAHPEE